jgi:GT2 family glycosyltransferase
VTGTPDMSLVVVTHNSADDLRALLPTVSRHLPEAEVVLVDNGSADGTAAVARGWPGRLTLIEPGANLGFGRASNLGMARAGSETIIMLNPDVLLVDASLAALGALARGRGGIWGPRLLNADRTRQPSASPVPGGWAALAAAVVPKALMPARVRAAAVPWTAERTVRVGWLTGACLVARRDVFAPLGPFSPDIFMYGEDMDLGLRAAERGVPSWFAPDHARVVHLGGTSAARAFVDGGAARKAAARRAIVRANLGPRREAVDHAAERLHGLLSRLRA